jgi:hypothetical protein
LVRVPCQYDPITSSRGEKTMVWVMAGVVSVLALLGVGIWFFAPSIRTFGGPSFEPTYKDDASVERAQQSGPAAGTGAGGGGA